MPKKITGLIKGTASTNKEKTLSPTIMSKESNPMYISVVHKIRFVTQCATSQ